jgi:16S rRNA (guanine966-N2)-methyltransferase
VPKPVAEVRIIGGDWRSRKLRFNEVEGLRPTPGRVRETLFNWLQYDVRGMRVLDLFAGTGALGFEAASRGASRVTQVELDSVANKMLVLNARSLNASATEQVSMDVVQFLQKKNPEPYDLIMMDPPFGKGLVECVLENLERGGWLEKASYLYIEMEKGLLVQKLPEEWVLYKRTNAGEVLAHLYMKSA